MTRPPLCTCDGTRHDRHPQRCPDAPASRPLTTDTLEMLNPQGQWVKAPTTLTPGHTYILRTRTGTR